MEKMTEVKIPATIWKRVLAYGIDSLVVSLGALVVWLEAGMYERQSGVFAYSLPAVGAMFIVNFFYHWLFVYFIGATPGKLLMGLRIVSENGEMGLLQVFLRVLADQLSIFAGHGLRALALMRLDRTHVSDWIAETRVIQLAQRRGPVKRHLLLAFILCALFSGLGFMKIYHLFQRASWLGDRVIITSDDNEF